MKNYYSDRRVAYKGTRKMTDLNEIAKYHGTDKASPGHAYTFIYEQLFKYRKNWIESVLEIGILYGASLWMWENYFPNAKIYGIDIHSYDQYPDGKWGDRIQSYQVDVNDTENLVKVAEKIGQLDLIVDDGSHKTYEQIIALKTLLPFLKDEGLYIIEDIRTIDEIKPYLTGMSLNHWFAVANDTWPPKDKSGSILAIMHK